MVSDEQEDPDRGPSRQDLNLFAEKIAIANENRDLKTPLPEIEVPRRVIQHFNQRSMDGFDKCGYFVYQGVKVFEVGKKELAVIKDRRSMEDILHGRQGGRAD